MAAIWNSRPRRWFGAVTLAAVCAACTQSPADDVSAVRSAPTTSTSPSTAVETTVPVTTTVPTTTTTVPAAGPPALASSPEELAARVDAAEATTRDRSAPADDVARAGFELQVLYRQLARTPDWEPAVLAAVDPGFTPAVSANVAARREFRGMHSRLSDTLPAWRIIDPAPAEELLSYYEKGEATFGVPWEILAAVNLVETGMGRIEGFSVAGARGPMQFIPGTWEAFGEGDIDDPHDAIMAAARYLAHNGGGSGDIDNALFRYNNHNNYVRGVKAYASVMEADPNAFHGFYHWQILYLSEIGDIWLPVGYESPERVPVVDYVAANPTHQLGSATS